MSFSSLESRRSFQAETIITTLGTNVFVRGNCFPVSAHSACHSTSGLISWPRVSLRAATDFLTAESVESQRSRMSTRILRGLQSESVMDKNQRGDCLSNICAWAMGKMVVAVKDAIAHHDSGTGVFVSCCYAKQVLEFAKSDMPSLFSVLACTFLSLQTLSTLLEGRNGIRASPIKRSGDIALTSHFRSNVAVLVKAFLDRRISASFFTAVSVGSLPSSVADRWKDT